MNWRRIDSCVFLCKFLADYTRPRLQYPIPSMIQHRTRSLTSSCRDAIISPVRVVIQPGWNKLNTEIWRLGPASAGSRGGGSSPPGEANPAGEVSRGKSKDQRMPLEPSAGSLLPSGKVQAENRAETPGPGHAQRPGMQQSYNCIPVERYGRASARDFKSGESGRALACPFMVLS